MGEIRTGLRSLLSVPTVYELLQKLLGGAGARRKIIDEYIRPLPGLRILDVGCGPAAILAMLPDDIEYIGFDSSEEYIASARRRYTSKGRFYQGRVNDAAVAATGQVDLVIASGVLHHLRDDEVRRLASIAFDALRPGGRLLTIDPALEDGQSRFARFLIRRDRGQDVRSSSAYLGLLSGDQNWGDVDTFVRHDLLVFPYTHAIIECRKATNPASAIHQSRT